MRIPDAVIQRALELSSNTRLRWSCVPAHTRMCVGFTSNLTVSSLTVTPLTDDVHIAEETVACTTFPNVHWLYVTQTSGCALYQWREPTSRIRYDLFGCVKYGSTKDAYAASTMKYLAEREQHLRALLATGAPLPEIGHAVHGAGLPHALEAILLITWMRQQRPNDAPGLRQDCQQVWRLRENPSALRTQLVGSGLETLPDEQLVAAVKGMRAINRQTH